MSEGSPNSARNVILIIMVCVLGWGIYHAAGAYLNFGPNGNNPWRAVVVMGCVLGFLAFWGLMLASRRRRS